MKKKTITLSVLGTYIALSLGIKAAAEAGIHMNFTDSAPKGLWLETEISNNTVKRGMLVSICPPDKPVVRLLRDRGYLHAGDCKDTRLMPLGKPVRAIPGDVVRLKDGQPARVNGTSIFNTSAKRTITAWPDGEYTVKPGQVWIFSSYDINSFDSRYFGPVAVQNIHGEITPLIVNGRTEITR
ncbi:MAG: S26 family signal peptidase [Devosia sp.]